ncbi:hypothetical protein P9314_03455 [Paenibacillus validus]|uniref:hypothetical protein n=1 Tax=Paenibacillus TaxID=44249 RepID=UPI000FD9E2DB|nr:hypothetical protein [Paenibacillus validus]MED4599763.1 hypothetical protein [Paenibacillus validus]MED4604804.1 hypothetical protein [Paenibacillus validus]
MEEIKRMVDNYEVDQAISIGKVEVLLGIDETNAERSYMVCTCTRNNSLGVEQYYAIALGEDYLEAVHDFISRVQWELEDLKEERASVKVPLSPLTQAQCQPIREDMRIDNQVVVIRPERLRPEYRTAVNQLVLALSGFGTSANSRGRAVYVINLYTGEEARWNREDFMGLIKPEHMPAWAQEKLEQHQIGTQQKPKRRDEAR